MLLMRSAMVTTSRTLRRTNDRHRAHKRAFAKVYAPRSTYQSWYRAGSLRMVAAMRAPYVGGLEIEPRTIRLS